MFSKILIANRGEIACRIIESAHRMGIQVVAVFSDADHVARHVHLADEAVHIGAAPVGDSYLNMDRIIEAVLTTGAQAVHPGYGFLSENPDFVDALEAKGIVFIGPSAKSIRSMGLKDAAKSLMQSAGVPVVPGYHGVRQEPDYLAEQSASIGYPVLIKARAGGGGKGMRLVEKPEDFAAALASASREAEASFGDSAVLVEKFVSNPRHIEVQVFGDSHGNAVHLFERDCSLQRRHQKVLEEAPAPNMPESVRQAMTSAAVTAAKAIDYQGAGTIEFIVDGSGDLRPDGFWFMEMNTRLQVEHPVTEAITGLDLVEAQIRVAAGQALPFTQDDITVSGHAFEARLYAEDVPAGFLPSTGKIEQLEFDPSARNDTGVRAGDHITPYYDPMIAKITTHGESRSVALNKLRHSLEATWVAGTTTNLDFLSALASHQGFAQGEVDTGLIERDIDSLVCLEPPDEIAVLLAALTLHKIDPEKLSIGWRLWGDASVLCSLVHNGEQFDRRLRLSGQGVVSISTLEQNAPAMQLKVELFQGDQYRVIHRGRVRSAKSVSWEDESTRYAAVKWSGATYEFSLHSALNSAHMTDADPDAVVAPMSGVVRVLDAKVGDVVHFGDRLAVIEAMKMETTLTAPRDGIIALVNCAVNQSVEGGAVLVQLSTEPQ